MIAEQEARAWAIRVLPEVGWLNAFGDVVRDPAPLSDNDVYEAARMSGRAFDGLRIERCRP